ALGDPVRTSGAILGPFDTILWPFFTHWRPFCGGHLVTHSRQLQPFWRHLRPFWNHLGAILGTILGPFGHHFGNHFGTILAPFWEPFWDHFAPPQLRIIPERSGPALALTCHAWGFSPAEVTLRWLRNGIVVGDPSGQSRALPVGDGTFWAQATIEVPPGTGDTFACSALHPSLEEPLSVTWAPGLSPNLSLLVGLAVLTLLLGLFLFIFGLCRYLGPGGALGRAGDTQGTPGGHPRDPRP
uniref:Ig-like domain-containing protein n=1 Tax=Cyanoderma ruficeps TaxID=181631 RepID=A0A8C3NZZ3_9PASS